MKDDNEKRAFGKRLREVIREVHEGVRGPTQIAREFNLRYHGDPVTSQAVRKWLNGESLPSQEKMRTLAGWLNVSPQWLRFGEDERTGEVHALNQVVPRYENAVNVEALSRNFSRLNEYHKRVVVEIIHALLKSEGKR